MDIVTKRKCPKCHAKLKVADTGSGELGGILGLIFVGHPIVSIVLSIVLGGLATYFFGIVEIVIGALILVTIFYIYIGGRVSYECTRCDYCE